MPHSYSNRSLLPGWAALAVVGLVGSATAQDSTVIIAPSAPPPARVETMPPPPGSGVAWQAGHWYWNGTAWSWVEGHYVERPQATAVWQPGHWEPREGGGYVWVDGHWGG